MTEAFKIYIDRLKGGLVQRIEGAFDTGFLEIAEEELRFPHPVTVKGEAYLTEEHLVVHLSASTMAEMPCSVCNEMIKTPLTVGHFYHTEPLSDIRGALYDFGQALREALLIELPLTVECNKGRCPSRESIAPYLRLEKQAEQTTSFPFADLENNN